VAMNNKFFNLIKLNGWLRNIVRLQDPAIAFFFLLAGLSKLLLIVLYNPDQGKVDPILPMLMQRQSSQLAVIMDSVIFTIFSLGIYRRKMYAIVGYLITLAMLTYHVLTLFFGNASCGCAGRWNILSPLQQSAIDTLLFAICIVAHLRFVKSLTSEGLVTRLVKHVK
jgi:hypothetical protein